MNIMGTKALKSHWQVFWKHIVLKSELSSLKAWALLNKSRNTSEYQSVLSLTAFMFPVHSSQQAEAKDTGYFKTTSTNTTTTGKHIEYTTARQVWGHTNWHWFVAREGKDLTPVNLICLLASTAQTWSNFHMNNGETYLEFPRETLPTLLAESK